MKRSLQRGSAMVEFAMAAPLLILLFLGVWQFGYAFYLYNELEQAVRSGARYASVRTYDSGFQAAVKNMTVHGNPNPAAGAVPLVSRLQAGNVVVSPNPATGPSGNHSRIHPQLSRGHLLARGAARQALGSVPFRGHLHRIVI